MGNNARLFLVVGGVLFVLLTIIITISWLSDAKKTATIDIAVAPKSSSIRIGDKSYKNGEEHKIEPGKYNVVISMDGFKTHTEELVIEAEEIKRLYVSLEFLEGDVWEWYARHPGEDEFSMKIGGFNNTVEMERNLEQNPIMAHLPFNSTFYSIDATMDSDGRVAALLIRINMQEPTRENNIRAAEIYKSQALNAIREMGFNPEDFLIFYRWLP